MKKTDLNAFKGEIKDAMLSWADGKINELFPNRAAVKTLLKNGVNNYMASMDCKLNRFMDTGFLFLADENGVIDSDTMVDTLKNLFTEMEQKEFQFGSMSAVIGKGEAVIRLPRNFLVEMFVGEMGSVKLTVDDIDDLKSYIG